MTRARVVAVYCIAVSRRLYVFEAVESRSMVPLKLPDT
jgi:hypothetical protein